MTLQISGDNSKAVPSGILNVKDSGVPGLDGNYYKHYTSTYCIHGDHSVCKLTCKTCQSPCLCQCHRNQKLPKAPPSMAQILATKYGDGAIEEVLKEIGIEESKLGTEQPCGTCGMGSAIEDDKCPKSERPCGHHCNHVWTHDVCDWCGNTFET